MDKNLPHAGTNAKGTNGEEGHRGSLPLPGAGTSSSRSAVAWSGLLRTTMKSCSPVTKHAREAPKRPARDPAEPPAWRQDSRAAAAAISNAFSLRGSIPSCYGSQYWLWAHDAERSTESVRSGIYSGSPGSAGEGDISWQTPQTPGLLQVATAQWSCEFVASGPQRRRRCWQAVPTVQCVWLSAAWCGSRAMRIRIRPVLGWTSSKEIQVWFCFIFIFFSLFSLFFHFTSPIFFQIQTRF